MKTTKQKIALALLIVFMVVGTTGWALLFRDGFIGHWKDIAKFILTILCWELSQAMWDVLVQAWNGDGKP